MREIDIAANIRLSGCPCLSCLMSVINKIYDIGYLPSLYRSNIKDITTDFRITDRIEY